jgi:hypothetical protein
MAGGIQRLGESVTIVGTFLLNDLPVPFAPVTLTLTITPPDGSTPIVLTHPTALLLHHNAHEWYYDLTFTARGRWQADWLFIATYVDENGDVRPYREPVTQVLHCYA